MYRTSTGGFKTNIALGAEPVPCEITKELEDICMKGIKSSGRRNSWNRYNGR
ncbi:hypothetical protein DYY67_1307 [Candidatus Nitrosotalea sp. TS]|nr:hypothetical protein [Candidatus Nitrosotalea sp. TS]